MDSQDAEKKAQVSESPPHCPDTHGHATKNEAELRSSSQASRSATPIVGHVFRSSTNVGGQNVMDRGRDDDQVVTQPGEVVKIPRRSRRGLFGRFALVAEVVEPHDYDSKLKWFITFIVAFAGAAAPLGSAIFFPSLYQVKSELHTTATITNLAVALYMLSTSIFPLWWSAFSETFGRRTIYLASFAMFMLWCALAAISKSIGVLIAMRILGGGAAASVQAVGAGTIADIWEPKERGRAMGIFYLGPLCGPLFAPIIGGALAHRWDWRAAMWFLCIYGGATLILILLALPETLKARKDLAAAAEVQPTSPSPVRSTVSHRSAGRSIDKHISKSLRMARMTFVDPLKIILYFRFPAVFLTVYYASITFGSLYVLNISIQDMFEKQPYGFSTLIVGLLYLPSSLGYVVASLFGGKWMDAIMKREAVKVGRFDTDGKLIYRPEDRMRENAWLGAILYPAALICYGWTTEKGAYWVVPMIANFFFGVGSMLIFAMATTMLTEFMPRESSAGVALNNFMRNIFSCVGGIAAVPIINAIGNGWLFTILGLWALSSCAVIWAMRRFGPQWRVTMDKNLQ